MRSEGHHTYSISVRAPDRAFYLSSVSNNLVKLCTPRMGAEEGEDAPSLKEWTWWEGKRRMNEEREERINNLRCDPLPGILRQNQWDTLTTANPYALTATDHWLDNSLSSYSREIFRYFPEIKIDKKSKNNQKIFFTYLYHKFYIWYKNLIQTYRRFL